MRTYELNAENALLLIIDIQEKLVPAMGDGIQVVEKTRILLETANHLQMPSVVTQQYTQGLGNTVQTLEALLEKAERFEKMTFSGCTEDVMATLSAVGRNKVIITGMETHVCVFQTVRGLLAAGYEVFVVRDAVCSRTTENYLNGLALMQEMGAVVTNTETVFFDLLKAAGTESFRALRKLIK